ncbi:hypothetical protein [Actinobacillus pleuropneumoniae]|uniref:hypothetical protein n=1 Tax=Actinobacillus pleuropneumoniae TaxID=715 RepID=UPI003F7BFBFF
MSKINEENEKLKNYALTAYAILHEEFQKDPDFKEKFNNIFKEKLSKDITEEVKEQAFASYIEINSIVKKDPMFRDDLREVIINQFTDDKFHAVHFLFMAKK